MIKWIKVEDQLPKKEGQYSVLMNWSEMFYAGGSAIFKNGKFEEEIQLWCGKITHWQGR